MCTKEMTMDDWLSKEISQIIKFSSVPRDILKASRPASIQDGIRRRPG